MLSAIAKKVFGTKNDRDLKALGFIVSEINDLEEEISKLSDEGLREKTNEFRARIQEQKTEDAQVKYLDTLLPEAFAVCREASKRVFGMRHFDVQMVGGIVLHQGRIAEMRTGEGKTLMATLPVYLNALMGKGVHVVTVNDYLARRDSEWMGELYKFLGLTVGVIVNDMSDTERREAYASDVTYGQNNEFGFDYLRDNMKYRLQDYVQRDLFFAIVDEVDSILIDEARTPLIISGPTEDSVEKYYVIDKMIPQLKNEVDYTLDEKSKNALLTEDGISKVEKALNIPNLYDPKHIEIVHHVTQALRAHSLYHKDVDYMVKDGEVMIVDEFTGRTMPGRRWSDGLHQAIEAKEGVKIENENQTLASITFQNYFRMFHKLSGMTGTAETEAEEFHKIYSLDVVVVPTNKPMARIDHPDVIYRSEREKFEGIAKDVKELNEKGQPVLLGTVSIESSEKLSKYLNREGIKHNVLNAKQHEREAEFVKDAGQKGQVTIATNMAGRGTDIVLGEGVKEAGGLFIVGTERHESRRIDNQLRGRSGRQGDPGGSRFYLSFEDDLMRIFGGDRMKSVMDRIGMKEGEAIDGSKMLSRQIEGAQRRVEGHNFDIRKHLLKYDDVMNKQRKIIYALRKEVLGKEDISELIYENIETVAENLVLSSTSADTTVAEWDWENLSENLKRVFNLDFDPASLQKDINSQEDLRDRVCDLAEAKLKEKRTDFGDDLMNLVQREVSLRTIDQMWKDHLLSMDQLKEGVSWEGYAQKDPLVVYQMKGFEMFSGMIEGVKEASLERIFHVQIAPEQLDTSEEVFEARRKMNRSQVKMEKELGPSRPKPNNPAKEVQATVRRSGEKVGRNDPCPCGSGKKYKKCHGLGL